MQYGPKAPRISARSRPKYTGDASRGLYRAGCMDEKAIRRAVRATVRRANSLSRTDLPEGGGA
jgi:hypothetical protein